MFCYVKHAFAESLQWYLCLILHVSVDTRKKGVQYICKDVLIKERETFTTGHVQQTCPASVDVEDIHGVQEVAKKYKMSMLDFKDISHLTIPSLKEELEMDADGARAVVILNNMSEGELLNETASVKGKSSKKTKKTPKAKSKKTTYASSSSSGNPN
ncbi:uncharacterized protein [Amphiura filiformis]|uniref:uncharacterized protein n=1 Tax=Amphiura filiformis TaxID=82378 RepID=UPI003B22369E